MSERHTVESLEDRFWELGRVARMLPDRERGWLMRAYRSSHPETLANFWEAYQSEYAPRLKVRPSPEAIDRADEALGWLLLVPKIEDRTIVLGRGCRASWTGLARRLGMDRTTAKRRHKRALDNLASVLNGERPRPVAQFARF